MRLSIDVGGWDVVSIAELCELVVGYNVRRLRAMTDQVRFWRSGLRYVSDPPDGPWMSIDELLRRGKGDCEDLACALAACLRVYGASAALPDSPMQGSDVRTDTARVALEHYGDDQYHAIVRCDRLDGSVVDEDPSARLGMNGGRIDPLVQKEESMDTNTLIGEILGIALPQTQGGDDWGAKARVGNIEVWAREGVQFNLVQVRPGIYLVVEFPDEIGLMATLKPNKPTVGEGAGFWVGLAEGIGKAANSLTFGLIDGIGKYIPGAQKAIAKGETERMKAQEEAWRRQQKMQADLDLYRAKIAAQIAALEDDDPDNDEPEPGEFIPPRLGGRSTSAAVRTFVPTLPRRFTRRAAPNLGGACCRSCSVGGPCESECHG